MEDQAEVKEGKEHQFENMKIVIREGWFSQQQTELEIEKDESGERG